LITARTATLTRSILDIWPVPEGHVGLTVQPAQADTVSDVDLALLVSEGLIDAGATLVARPEVLKGATAAVGLDGRIFVRDTGYNTPSGAGYAVNTEGLYKGGINGWRFWKLKDSGKSLWDIRNEYLVSLGEESGGDEPGEDEQESEQFEAEIAASENPNGNGDDNGSENGEE
jgi:hypothetical protein